MPPRVASELKRFPGAGNDGNAASSAAGRSKRTSEAVRRQLAVGSRWNMRVYHVAAYRVWKRMLDLVVAASVGIAVAPIVAAVAVLIRLHDGGPVLYWQTRVGKRGRHFAFPKFRSMVVDAEAQRQRLQLQNDDADGVKFKMKRDPRITPIGRFIRKYSIDELPQLWCVMRGDMTLVGPRPPLVSEVPKYSASDWGRLDVVPGLTCLWQVSGRSDLSFRQQVALDLEYIRTRSVFTDLRILAQTVPAVMSGRGAY